MKSRCRAPRAELQGRGRAPPPASTGEPSDGGGEHAAPLTWARPEDGGWIERAGRRSVARTGAGGVRRRACWDGRGVATLSDWVNWSGALGSDGSEVWSPAARVEVEEGGRGASAPKSSRRERPRVEIQPVEARGGVPAGGGGRGGFTVGRGAWGGIRPEEAHGEASLPEVGGDGVRGRWRRGVLLRDAR